MYSVSVSVWHRVSTPYCSIAVFGDFFAILRYLANFSAVLRCSEPPNVPLYFWNAMRDCLKRFSVIRDLI